MALQIWMPLNGDINNQGLNDLSFTNTNATVEDGGKIGKCYHFNGTNTRISSPEITLSYPLSICAWVKCENATGSATQYIISYNTATGGFAGHTIGICIYNKKLSILHNGEGTQYATALTNGIWYHIAAVVTTSSYKLYLNGSEIISGTGTQSEAESKFITIGARSNSSTGGVGAGVGYFTGYINDVRLYNHALSPREVKEISKGLVLHYPLAMPGNENYAKNTNQVFTSPASTSGSTYCSPIYINLPQSEITTDTQFTMSFNYEVIGNSATDAYIYDQLNGTTTSKVLYISGESTETGRYVHTYTPTSSQASYTSSPNIRVRLRYATDGAVLKIWNVKHEKGDHATPWIPATIDPEYTTLGFDDGIEYDVSGYGYNATIVDDVSYSSDTPRYNTALSLDGNGHINCGHAFHIEGALNVSISLWAYLDDWEDNVSEQFLSSEEAGGIVVAKGSANGVRGRFNVYTAEDLSSHAYKQADVSVATASSIGVTGSGWHHIATTYDANVGIKTYIDGVERATSNFVSYGVCFNSSASMMLGAECAGSNNYGVRATCKLSDVRFYYTTLTDDDVLELYHTPTSLSNNGTLLTQGEYEES